MVLWYWKQLLYQLSHTTTALVDKCLYHNGSGCSSVGRVVASYTRGPRFESSHWQTFDKHLLTVLKIRIERKEAGNGP